MIMPLLFIVNPVHFMVFFPAKVRIPALLLSVLFLCLPAFASNQTALVQLVEYVGADYINAVVDGDIVSPEEYAEMEEFTALLAQGVAQLPAADGKQDLQDKADALQRAVIDKAVEPRIKELTQSIRATLVTVYGIPVSPKAAPDLERAAELYQTQCAACHGAEGRGDGLSAYLDGFEMIEQQLAAVDGDLMRVAEADFMAVREAIDRNQGAERVSERVATARTSLAEAAEALSGDGLSPAATFSASFFILFREGLEALLVVAALLTFTRKANAVSATRHIHLGWIAALVAGGLTWYAANSLVTFSGASREMTEGVAGVVAALILFYVGFWMHSNSNSQKWMGYIRSKVDDALGSGTVWVLTFVAFISVYREIFETILFYQALWSQVTSATQAFLFYGIAAAVASLAVVCVLFFRVGMRLPLSLFFRVTSLVLLVLSVVLLGRGIAALQEAGVLSAYYLGVPTIEWLGFFPTVQGVAAQVLAVLLGVVLWLRGNHRQQGR